MDIFRGYGIEIELTQNNDKSTDSFKSLIETLQRIGIASKQTKTLYQSCHVLHKQGRYAIMHFKEMFGLDGRSIDISEEDYLRRNKITEMLEDWGLLKIKGYYTLKDKSNDDVYVKVLKHDERKDWILSPKYLFFKEKDKKYGKSKV